VPVSVLNKFVKMHGEIDVKSAAHIADRLRTFLRGIEPVIRQQAGASRPSQSDGEVHAAIKAEKAENPNIGPVNAINAERWIIVERTAPNQSKIHAVVLLIESIILRVNRSNVPEAERLLTSVERAQLIAVLETALNVLRSPAVEKGLLRKVSDVLKQAAKKSADKQLEEGLGKLMREGGNELWELIKQIFT
jgi:hypothetical protein